jgi:hypothetical protein
MSPRNNVEGCHFSGSEREVDATYLGNRFLGLGRGGQATSTPTTANVLLRNWRFMALEDIPGAMITGYNGADDRGQTVGSYVDGNDPNRVYGFLRERDGTIRTIDVPGAQVTLLYDINNRGQIVGTYIEEGLTPDPNSPAPPGFQHAFLWENGKVTNVEPPDTVYTPNAYSISDRGQIMGVRADAQQNQLGFLRDPSGTFTTLDPPEVVPVTVKSLLFAGGLDRRSVKQDWRPLGPTTDTAGLQARLREALDLGSYRRPGGSEHAGSHPAKERQMAVHWFI